MRLSPSPNLLGEEYLPARTFAGVAFFAAVALATHPAHAETLAHAIAEAYRHNPTLQAQRAQLQATDEGYVQALAGWRPTVSVGGNITYTKQPESQIFSGVSEVAGTAGTVALSITQPIYTGGRTAAAVGAARAQILAGREQLRATEATVINGVVQAYMDVLRDEEIVQVRSDTLAIFEAQLHEAEARRDAGDATKTDVAEAQTQLESTRGLLNSARAQLESSRGEYFDEVGEMPDHLTPSPAIPGLPATIDEAFALSDHLSPALLQSQLTERASRARVAEIRAGSRPTVSLQAGIGYTALNGAFEGNSYQRAVSGEVTVNQPLFAGGAVASQVRQALAQNASDQISIEGTRRSIIQALSQDWGQMIAARANIAASESQIAAATTAVEGDQAEYREGLRSTIDVLIAEEDLEAAKLNNITAKHDAYVAETAVIAVVGRLEVGQILTNVGLYDPSRSLRHSAAVGAVPWEGLIGALDSLGSPAETRGDQPQAPRGGGVEAPPDAEPSLKPTN